MLFQAYWRATTNHKNCRYTACIRPRKCSNPKTVLFRIISIVRVPSLCFNKDTHDNFDDELECFSLSVKLESIDSAKTRSTL